MIETLRRVGDITLIMVIPTLIGVFLLVTAYNGSKEYKVRALSFLLGVVIAISSTMFLYLIAAVMTTNLPLKVMLLVGYIGIGVAIYRYLK